MPYILKEYIYKSHTHTCACHKQADKNTPNFNLSIVTHTVATTFKNSNFQAPHNEASTNLGCTPNKSYGKSHILVKKSHLLLQFYSSKAKYGYKMPNFF